MRGTFVHRDQSLKVNASYTYHHCTLIIYELHVASYSLIILIVCVDSSGVNVYVMVVCLYVYM